MGSSRVTPGHSVGGRVGPRPGRPCTGGRGVPMAVFVNQQGSRVGWIGVLMVFG